MCKTKQLCFLIASAVGIIQALFAVETRLASDNDAIIEEFCPSLAKNKTEINERVSKSISSPRRGRVKSTHRKKKSRGHRHSHKPPRFHKPAYISQEVWNTMRPYFLPRDHPVRTKLDKMFCKQRVTANSQTLTEVGFYGRKGNRAGRFSNATVACHEKFQGYVLKFFTDDSAKEDWVQLKKRIDGSISLQAAIERYGWQKWFKTPRKWIYPMPASPAPLIVEGIPVKGFVLVAEDMLLLKRSQNYMHWRQNMTPAKLDALHTLLQEEGLLDSVYPFNIPFCCDGRIAFIDLEHNHLWPVPFYKLQTYLSSTLQPYWQMITTPEGNIVPAAN